MTLQHASFKTPSTEAKTVFHAAGERGKSQFGWLESYHSFSFGNFYHPEKTQFGLLRVLNDDTVIGGAGFGTHSHQNFEIISIPLEGALHHRDSTGREEKITSGEVQIMSAGKGIAHSEYNASETQPVHFLQIWVIPKVKDIEPRYEQKVFNLADRRNQFQVVVSPDLHEGGVWINQDSRFYLGRFDKGMTPTLPSLPKGFGRYVFLIEGEMMLAGESLQKRDALGYWDGDVSKAEFTKYSDVLMIDVPMQ